MSQDTTDEDVYLASSQVLRTIPLVVVPDEEERERSRKKREQQAALRAARRRWWVRSWFLRRVQQGHILVHTLLQELQREDECRLRNFLRIDAAILQEILEKVQGKI